MPGRGLLVSIAGSNPSAFQADSFQQVLPLPFCSASTGRSGSRRIPRAWRDGSYEPARSVADAHCVGASGDFQSQSIPPAFEPVAV